MIKVSYVSNVSHRAMCMHVQSACKHLTPDSRLKASKTKVVWPNNLHSLAIFMLTCVTGNATCV